MFVAEVDRLVEELQGAACFLSCGFYLGMVARISNTLLLGVNVMVSVKKLIAAGAALSMVATPVLAASTSHVQNAAKDIRVGSHVNTAESEGLFDEHKTRDLLLLLLLLGGGAGLYFALHSTSP